MLTSVLMTWLAAAAAAQTTGFDVHADGGRLHRLVGSAASGRVSLLFSRSDDAGRTWSAPKRVDRGLPAPYRFVAGDARVAASGDVVLAVWSRKGNGPMETGALVVARSEDGGKTWSAAASPSGEGAFGRRFPALAASGGVFTAAWLDRASNAKVLAARSEDGGRSWSKPAVLDSDVCECCWNAVRADGARVSVLYRDRDPRDMAVASTSDGRSWRSKPVSPFGWRFNGCPHVGGALAAAGGKEHALAWTGKDGAMGLYVVAEGGAPVRVGGEGAKHGDLAGSGGRLAAVWDEGGGVWAATAPAGGAWAKPRRLSGAGTRAGYPRVVAAGAGFRAFWLEKDAAGAASLRQAALP